MLKRLSSIKCSKVAPSPKPHTIKELDGFEWLLAVRVQVYQLERLLAVCGDKENSSAPEHSACCQSPSWKSLFVIKKNFLNTAH
jgi:hypothetical protein